MDGEKETTKTEKNCPLTFRIDDNEDFLYYPCLKSECQCWIRDLDGTERCGLINRK